MPSKCTITGNYCPFQGDFWDTALAGTVANDNCPIQKYKSSSYYYPEGYKDTKGRPVKFRLDDVCRYYGIARAKQIENENFMEA